MLCNFFFRWWSIVRIHALHEFVEFRIAAPFAQSAVWTDNARGLVGRRCFEAALRQVRKAEGVFRSHLYRPASSAEVRCQIRDADGTVPLRERHALVKLGSGDWFPGCNWHRVAPFFSNCLNASESVERRIAPGLNGEVLRDGIFRATGDVRDANRQRVHRAAERLPD